MASRNSETEISTHTHYIVELCKLNAAFKDRGSFEMITLLTNSDFDNSQSSLAKHKQNPYVLRSINFMEMQGQKKHVLNILDFQNNIRLSVLEDNIQVDEIGNPMLQYLHQKYDLRYNGVNPPTYNPG